MPSSAYFHAVMAQHPAHFWMAEGRGAKDWGLIWDAGLGEWLITDVPAPMSWGSGSQEVVGAIQGEAGVWVRGRSSGSNYIGQAAPAAMVGAHSLEILFKLLALPSSYTAQGLYLMGSRPSDGGYAAGSGKGGTELVVTSSGKLRFGLSDGAASLHPTAPADPTWPMRGGATDFLKVEVTSAGTCEFINTAFSGGDSYGAIYDNAGTLITSDDDAAGGGRWKFTPTLAVGTYWVAMMPYSSSGTGNWTVRANPGTAVLATPSGPMAVPFSAPHTAVPLPPSTDVTGALAGAGATAEYGSALSINVWHQVVFTVGVAPKEWKLYVDGALIASGTHALSATTLQVFHPTLAPLTVGNYGRNIDNNWAYEGHLSHLAAFPSVLAAADIADHYTAMLGSAATMQLVQTSVPVVEPSRAVPLALAPCADSGGGASRPLEGQLWPRG